MQRTGALYQAYFQGFIYVAFLATDINLYVKHAVKLLVPSSRNESPAQVANIHSVMTLGAERR